MITASSHRRRARGFLGAIKMPSFPGTGITLTKGGAIEQPPVSGGSWGSWSQPALPGTYLPPQNPAPTTYQAEWFITAVGPTAGGTPGTSPPPPPQTAAGTAINEVTGGGSSVPVPPAAQPSSSPVATEPTANVVVVGQSPKRWIGWAIGAAALAAVGAYVMHHR